MFYVEKDNKIVLFNEDKQNILNTQEVFSDYAGLEIKETDRPIVDYMFADTEEFNTKQKEKEEDFVNRLTMTALDLINVLKSAGLTSQQIEDYLNTNLEVRHQLQYCQNVFCGVVRQLLPLTIGDVIITDDFIVSAFKNKYEAQLNANI